jgi:hypothetical protein
MRKVDIDKIFELLNYINILYIEPFVSHFEELNEMFTPNQAFDAVKFYIQENLHEFFPSRFRHKFESLAHKTISIRDKINELKLEFKKINVENKSRIIFIFDHILE